MIKNIYKILFTVSTSLFLSLVMTSCGSDSPSQQSPDLQIWDVWTSTTHAYYTNDDCAGTAMTFNEYADLMIDNAITAEAQIWLDAECLDPETQAVTCDLETWRAHVIGEWADSEIDEEQIIIDDIISTTGIPATSLDSVELLISVNMTFDVSYDGFCTNLSDIAINLEPGECNIGGESIWTESGCTFPTEDSCPSYIGTWDTGYEGNWDEYNDNYLISWTTNLGTANQATHTKTLIYSEDTISMIEYTSADLCISLDFTRK